MDGLAHGASQLCREFGWLGAGDRFFRKSNSGARLALSRPAPRAGSCFRRARATFLSMRRPRARRTGLIGRTAHVTAKPVRLSWAILATTPVGDAQWRPELKMKRSTPCA